MREKGKKGGGVKQTDRQNHTSTDLAGSQPLQGPGLERLRLTGKPQRGRRGRQTLKQTLLETNQKQKPNKPTTQAVLGYNLPLRKVIRETCYTRDPQGWSKALSINQVTDRFKSEQERTI